jgi:hypothetical protein
VEESCECGNEHLDSNTEKYLSSCTTGDLSRRAQLHAVGKEKK